MPAEEGVGLDNEEGLFPERRRSGQQKKPEAVPIAQFRAFDLAMEDDELVPEEGIFGDEMGSTANRILGGSCKQ